VHHDDDDDDDGGDVRDDKKVYPFQTPVTILTVLWRMGSFSFRKRGNTVPLADCCCCCCCSCPCSGDAIGLPNAVYFFF
jgi:hypothetical protein